jgi:hypothetical protein
MVFQKNSLAAALVGLLLLVGCSSDYMREHEAPGTKNGVITDLHKYCLAYPKDSACQGPASK